MNTPKRENVLLKRLKGLFRRAPKPNIEVTSETRDKRAFSITLGTGIFFLIIVIVYSLGENGRQVPTSLADTRVSAGLDCIAAFIGAWFARRGKSSIGIGIFLSVFYVLAFISVLGVSGAGIAVAAVLMSITLGITSATMTASVARRVNVIALLFGVAPILLDLFEPYPRKADANPGASAMFAVLIIIVYAAVIVRRFNTYNLRTKFLIAFGGVAILPLLVLGFYANSTLSSTLYQNAQITLSEYATQAASRLDTFIDTQLTAINAQSQNPPVIQLLSLASAQRTGSAEEKNAQNALAAFAHQDKFINTYTLLDEKGELVLDVNNTSAEDRKTAFLQQVFQKKQAAISGPLIDQKSGKASLYFSTPVKSETGATLGLLVLEYDASVIESLVDALIPIGSSKSILFRVVDADNFVRIANTDDNQQLYKSYKDLTPAEVSALQKKGVLLPGTVKDAVAVEAEMVTGLENVDKSPSFTIITDKALLAKDINSAVRLKNVPWLAFTTEAESAILTPVVEQRRTTVWIFLGLLTLVTLIAVGLSQLLASPILKLASTAEKIAAGDLSLQSDIESNDEIGTLAGAFNEMTRQSRALIDSLEQRSKALATSSEVSRRISTILDQQELVTEVVKQVQSAFGYYHAHIYLLDENTKELVMAGGTGEAGKAMLARGHRISVGKGLVGRAAQNNVTVLVADVSRDPQWLPNPLLPDTKSEVAVPISIAERVLGVLDVQHNEAGTLKQEDVDVLQSIANQVAFAVRNARSYSDVQAKADRESLITSIGQKIQGTITVESAMQVAIREIGRALNGAKTQIVLNEDSKTGITQQNKDNKVQL